MDKFGKSQSVRRFEDLRFTTGQGRYVDDIAPRDALYGVFVRSQVAHGKLRPVDLSEIREMPGVIGAYAAEDLEALGVTYVMKGVRVPNRDGTMGADTDRRPLAKGKVRFVGEAVALIVAETKAQARDAAEATFLEIEDLPAKVDVAPGGPVIHETAPDNVAYDWTKGDDEAVEKAFAGAAHVVKTRVVDNRIVSNPMEPRGAFAEWDGERLHVAFSGQGVWNLKASLVAALGLEPEQVRVTNPDVGGGFGTKGMDYPEYFALAAAARDLGRPVRWMADRTETMLTDNAGRDLVSETELAFDSDLKLVGYRVDTVSNIGAYNSQFGQAIQSELFSMVAMGVYDVQAVHLHSRAIYTTTTQVDAYRGAGRPEAIFALERSMDNAARQLGVDPWVLRRRSFIPPSKFPYKTAIAETYDVGDFNKVMDRALIEADVAGYEERRAASEAKGLIRGIGLSFYIESILGNPEESARVVFEEDGTVSLYVGTQSNGQGHETVFATFLADHTGIPVEQVRVVQGDSDRIPMGGGTGGSRSGTVQATATLATVDVIRTSFANYLGEKTGTDGIEFDDEHFRIPGTNDTPTMLDVAQMVRDDGRTDLLDFSQRITLEARSFPNGAHVAEVEVDPETGKVTLASYTVTDDFGNLLSPMLVEGQIHGGVAQGAGQALLEQVVYDDNGQLLTATFMDYAMPRAADIPMIKFTNVPVPSVYNPMGMKGCGEAGTVGALAAIANAVTDAVTRAGGAEVHMPFTPERVWRALNAGSAAAE